VELVITVDTEEDDEWSPRPSTTCENLRFAPRFQELCEGLGFPVTWLLTHAAATSPLAPAAFGAALARGGCEVGAHLHPWNTPPHAARAAADGSFHRPYPLEYPRDVQREMLANLTGAIEQRLGVRPRSYRAGRYGFDATGAELLREAGYEVDCSVTPGVSWRRAKGRPDGSGGPDFVTAPAHPHWLAAPQLLEVPVTIVHLRAPLRGDHALARAWSRATHDGFAARVARKLGLARKWLRPYPKYSLADLRAVCAAARAGGASVLEMILHSSELMPGGSPYRRDAAAVDALHRDVGELLRGLAREGVRGTTLLAFKRRFAAPPRPRDSSRPAAG